MGSVRSAIISAVIVGGGQIYSGRIWTGVWLAIIFYGTIALMAVIWTGINQAVWMLIAAWLIVWLYNIIDAYKGATYDKPPCERECPAGMPSWIYLNFLAGKTEQAFPFWPFFRTLALICPAPCEDKCTRRAIDQPIAIRYLKSFIKTVKQPESTREPKFKVAVVGAGPCGLAFAYALSLRGHLVTIFEKETSPGGILKHYIPKFRLPSSVLDQDINDLLVGNVELRCGTEVGKDIQLADLFKNFYRVFLATGAWQEQKLGIPGEDECLSGLALLRETKRGKSFKIGTVGVIGGGNTAFDVARTMRRFANDVTIFYRRRIEDMPAERESIAEATAEGIKIEPLVLPVGVAARKVTFVRTELVDGKPIPVKKSEFQVELDKVVVAVGQTPDPGFVSGLVTVGTGGRIAVRNSRTTDPRIFAGGDVVLGASTLAHAVGQGLEAAEMVDFDLRRIPRFWGRFTRKSYFPKVKMLPFTSATKLAIPTRPVGDRVKDFVPVETSTSPEGVCAEAGRCLTCPLKYRL